MAHNRDYKPEDILFPEQLITQSDLVKEMQTSYIDYAMSVIVGRALPDVRDGLKPVHRRILYAMYEEGLTRDKPYRKSVAAVGDVLGRYHPHGEASVYDALVRMAQDFSMRCPLIDGHGNFGSVDGDPPAAYRYTEARMARISDEMLRDIDKETVDFLPNFDETRKEPQVLPSRFPNLLVNGSAGIAVGMATNIPPHNLGEVINAAIEVLDNPGATLEDLMRHVKGPDFPTKGIIMGRAGIRAAYGTGRGKITVRARAVFEEHGKDNRTRIIVEELPYQVNKRLLIKAIADQVKEKRLDEISDLRDESDRNGMRIVIELKRDANPQIVLNKLYSQTQMQTTFGVNMLALVANQTQPKILSLRHILDEYLAFQEQIIVRRTQFDLKKALERAHLLEGLLIAQDHIDEVIHTIRNSYDNAKQNLMARFELDEVQAQAICDMRLIALQGLNREKLEAEYKELEANIAWYRELLADIEKVKGVLREELIAIRDKYADPRQTEIQDVSGEVDIEDLIPLESCVVTLTHVGYVKRQPADTYKAQKRGGRGITGTTTRDEDFVEELFVCSSHDYLMFLTSMGRVYRMKAYEIPEGSRTSRGTSIANLLPLMPEEKVTSVIRVSDLESEAYLVMVTRKGIIKRSALSLFANIRKSGIYGIVLDEGDELAWAKLTDGTCDLIVATANGMAIRFDENDARPLGRTTRGVKAITLDEDDFVVGMSTVRETGKLLTVTEDGKGRLTELSEYRAQLRGGHGVTNYHRSKGKTVAGVKVVDSSDDIILISQGGIIIRMSADDIATQSRYGGGVNVMRLGESDRVVTVARAEREDDKAGESDEDELSDTESTDTNEE